MRSLRNYIVENNGYTRTNQTGLNDLMAFATPYHRAYAHTTVVIDEFMICGIVICECAITYKLQLNSLQVRNVCIFPSKSMYRVTKSTYFPNNKRLNALVYACGNASRDLCLLMFSLYGNINNYKPTGEFWIVPEHTQTHDYTNDLNGVQYSL